MVQKYLLTFAKTGDTQVNCLVVDPDELHSLCGYNTRGIDIGQIAPLPFVDSIEDIMSYLIQYNKPTNLEFGQEMDMNPREEDIGTHENRERRVNEIPDNDNYGE